MSRHESQPSHDQNSTRASHMTSKHMQDHLLGQMTRRKYSFTVQVSVHRNNPKKMNKMNETIHSTRTSDRKNGKKSWKYRPCFPSPLTTLPSCLVPPVCHGILCKHREKVMQTLKNIPVELRKVSGWRVRIS